MCGDFNLKVDPHLDISSPSSGRSVFLRHLLYSEGVYDVWRCQHASEQDYTFFSSRHHSYSCIDLFVTNQWLLQRVSSSSIHNITWSDHAAMFISIEDQDSPSRTPM